MVILSQEEEGILKETTDSSSPLRPLGSWLFEQWHNDKLEKALSGTASCQARMGGGDQLGTHLKAKGMSKMAGGSENRVQRAPWKDRSISELQFCYNMQANLGNGQDREAPLQTQTHTHTQKKKRKEREREREREKQANKQTDGQTDKQTDGQTCKACSDLRVT